MSTLINAVLNSDERSDLRQFTRQLHTTDKKYWLRNDIAQAYEDFCKSNAGPPYGAKLNHLNRLVNVTQEIILEDNTACWIIRPQIARQSVYRLLEDMTVEPVSTKELLELRDRFVNRHHPNEGELLEFDMQPFYDYSPVIRDPKNIGKGVAFLNRYLSSKLFQDPRQWQDAMFNFMQLHSHNGFQLLINERIRSHKELSERVKDAIEWLSSRDSNEPFDDIRFDLQSMGFEPGWGNTVQRISETLDILDQLIDSPDHDALESFISRIPMVFRIAIISPHGWFGQEGVLGRPDTGGQVVYILDQVKSLEHQLKEDIALAGLHVENMPPKVIVLTRLIPNSDGTNCNQPLEKIYGTDDGWILRVPFRDFNPTMTQNWISRFEIWPYLETFAIDSENALKAEFGGKPDLIIGNYSDGNLVAFLLARRLQVTQCNIAHALEKSKYLFSNLYWQDLEDKYHFSLQFTADLITMNAANFIVSSTYQEIVGTSDSVGQYESYQNFTMPDLYHVSNGIELFSPKFNIVPPGVNEAVFFPYTKRDDRLLGECDRLNDLLFTLDDPEHTFGVLDDPDKRPLFSMARLDRIKNLTGLAQCFGKSPELQDQCNLILIAGKLRTDDSTDHEEIEQIETLYRTIDEYNLHGKVRWLGVRLPKMDSGEVYRIIADRQGIFVQPALFEAFGLTVLESMVTGLPTFATRFGGPLEIIQNKVNGFLINPTNHEEMAAIILEFCSKCQHNPGYWSEISKESIQRVYTTYTWKIHCNRLLSLSKIYGFWNYTSKEKREDMLLYLEALFQLLYKPRAKELLEHHQHR